MLGMTLPGGAAYATPRRGGTLKLGLAGGHTTDTMDPLTTLDNVQVILCWATYNNLVELNEKREAIPELAESWEAEPGAKVWHFNLRKDAEFHNGKSLDADDVIYSLNRHRGPDTKSGSAGLMKSITDIKKTSKHQVRVELAGGNADLPYVFSAFHLCITPAEYSDWANPVGTGPYRMTAYEAGVRGAGERDPNYWKEGRAHVDSYEVTAINDETARMNALRSGEVHVASLVSTRLAAKLDAEPGISVVRSPGPQHYTMPMDVRAAPFSDNHVRMALKHSIDREGVLNSIASGYGSLGNDHPIGPSDPFYNHELPIRPYDPDKAKWHLKQAGMDSLSVDLSASEAAGPGGLDLALLLQESAKASGIAINLVREAGGRLLGERVAQEALHGVLLERARDHRHDAHARLLVRVRLERDPLPARRLRRPAGRGACLARLRQAPRDLLGAAADAERGGRKHHSDFQRLPRRLLDLGRRRCARRGPGDGGRPPDRALLAGSLIRRPAKARGPGTREVSGPECHGRFPRWRIDPTFSSS